VAEHDVVIRGGTVVDGTGSPRRTADVAVDGGLVTEVGRVDGRGRRELDADGLVVAPGWVDVHTHYDGQASWDPLLTPSSWHGVTTVVMGNCGVGFAPVRPDRHEWLVALMEGVEDIPGTALHEGISWEWESFPEYLDALARSPKAIDVAAQVPHGALRGYVMGDCGADHEAVPDADEIERMGRLAAEGIEAGALGFTTSRTVAHRSSDGRPTPSLTATADELLGIARAVGATGKGVFQAVADLDDLAAEFALLRAMAEVAGRPMSITTLQRPGQPSHAYRDLLELITRANEEGVEMRSQVAARPVGLILSLQGTVHPLRPSATFQSLAGLPHAELVAELRRPEVRARILEELAAPGADLLAGFPPAFALGDRPRYDQPAGDAVDLARAYDVLLEHDGTGTIYVPVMNYVDGDMAAVREMLVHPLAVPGLGDAGAHCTMICDASFCTYLVQHWTREAPEDQRLDLEWVVHRQAAATAALVGLHDRGLLAPGRRADVNLFDPDRLGIGRTEMLHDLPAGGKRLVQRGLGYRATVVAGEVVMEDGEPTGALPGGLVRGARTAA
jgi:N-acyl-D-aspartate/D-glutamate deacylase